MSTPRKNKAGLEDSLNDLSISGKGRRHQGSGPVAETWEEEEISASASSDSDSAPRPHQSYIPDAPPPTPISPSVRSGTVWENFHPAYLPPSTRSHVGIEAQTPSSRPEKSSATAGRMIAGALGVKPPRKSKEAQAYEHAVREKELRRISREREEGKAEEEKRQQARKQVWEE